MSDQNHIFTKLVNGTKMNKKSGKGSVRTEVIKQAASGLDRMKGYWRHCPDKKVCNVQMKFSLLKLARR